VSNTAAAVVCQAMLDNKETADDTGLFCCTKTFEVKSSLDSGQIKVYFGTVSCPALAPACLHLDLSNNAVKCQIL